MVLDFLSKTLNFTFHFDKKFNAEVGTLHTDSHKVFFLKPLTFMNLSGESMILILPLVIFALNMVAQAVGIMA